MVVRVTGYGLRHLGSNSCSAFSLSKLRSFHVQQRQSHLLHKIVGEISKMLDVEFSIQSPLSMDSEQAVTDKFPNNWDNKGI